MLPSLTLLVLVIFAFTYALIAVRKVPFLPIGRPAGALLGAVLMVAVGALSPAQSFAAIDHNTIVLLFGMMLLTAYLRQAGFFEYTTALVLGRCKSAWSLLVALSVAAAVLSAFLVNDTVCVFLTPMVVNWCRRARLPMGPYLIALATSANIGSSATLVGNPQNMIIGSMSGLGFARFAAWSGAAAAVGLLINIGLLALYYKRSLPSRMQLEPAPSAALDPRKLVLALVVLGGILVGFLAGFHLGYTTLAGVLVLVLADRKEPRETLAQVDWALLVFFSGLFIVIAAVGKTGLVQQIWTAAAPHMNLMQAGGLGLFTALMTLGSNLVSNVPMVLLTGPQLHTLASAELGWVLLAFSTTVAGNLTLVGSVANIIVAEGAKDHYTLGFGEYLRFGLVSTLLVLAAGVPVLWASARLFCP